MELILAGLNEKINEQQSMIDFLQEQWQSLIDASVAITSKKTDQKTEIKKAKEEKTKVEKIVKELRGWLAENPKDFDGIIDYLMEAKPSNQPEQQQELRIIEIEEVPKELPPSQLPEVEIVSTTKAGRIEAEAYEAVYRFPRPETEAAPLPTLDLKAEPSATETHQPATRRKEMGSGRKSKSTRTANHQLVLPFTQPQEKEVVEPTDALRLVSKQVAEVKPDLELRCYKEDEKSTVLVIRHRGSVIGRIVDDNGQVSMSSSSHNSMLEHFTREQIESFLKGDSCSNF